MKSRTRLCIGGTNGVFKLTERDLQSFVLARLTILSGCPVCPISPNAGKRCPILSHPDPEGRHDRLYPQRICKKGRLEHSALNNNYQVIGLDPVSGGGMGSRWLCATSGKIGLVNGSKSQMMCFGVFGAEIPVKPLLGSSQNA